MMKIVLAFDSFKGSLSADEAVRAAADGVDIYKRSMQPASVETEVVMLPLADGGEGTTDALRRYFCTHTVECAAANPLSHSIIAHYAISDDGQTAIMEMAAAAGLTLIDSELRNPMTTTTYGVGEMMIDAARRGCKRVLIGIGGSATNDCGMGMLAALGARFLDENGETLTPVGSSLGRVVTADRSTMANLNGMAIDVICDVDNPLFGDNGAAFVYAPQKGANPDDVRALDDGMRHFATLFKVDASAPGAGAAGGLGYGLMLIGGRLMRGADVVLEAANLRHHLRGADLVITGEGKIDRQTLNGKLPFSVMRCARSLGVPTIAVAGMVEDVDALKAAGFMDAISINPTDLPLHTAMRPDIASQNLRDTVARVVKKFAISCL